MSGSADDHSLTSRVRLAVMRLNRRLRAQRTNESVTLSQVSALSSLHKCGPMTPGELAGREGVQPPSMTRVIAALEDMGYISKRAHPNDGRQVIVELTEQGLGYIEADVAAREAWLHARLSELDDTEREALSRAAEIIDRMAGQ
ncbi:MarR family winged helix-turn-helix transcriptional regulator [Kibdelosporangium phytohabitans]|uniref:MarR family transcriptional regulator n=1 Tax=Kibdelosporangium phytohabitans TaxID=860235 RepID=A0A0N9HW64_9PSEU|nr:MarR family transcriptional regulator [Kibdelosporangium phytohabitans]ALG06036.1 MarR family transcriptional regulator [Kibdelosporangium phytohabitans]MBE1465890.1 DNA-binding MarR family transcriptional regulator [Kibdelosporangium phytohabitans]